MTVNRNFVPKLVACAAALSGSGWQVSASSGPQSLAAVRRAGSCSTANALSCSENYNQRINGTMSLYGLNAYDGRENCLIEHCSAGRVFTNPKDFGLEGHGSLLIFDDSNDQDKFKNLMVRIFTKLKCLLDNAGPKVKASDNSDFSWYLCKKNEPQFCLKLSLSSMNR